MDIERLVVPGFPVDEVTELDRRLGEHRGGAQVWRLTGPMSSSAAIGVAYPELEQLAGECRGIVKEWMDEQQFA